jgi:hypothetical protein
MNSEIYSILAKAINRAAEQDKKPCEQQKISVCDKKVVACPRQPSDDQNYVDEDLDKSSVLLMNTNHDLLYSQIEALYSLPTKELRQLWKEKMGTKSATYMQKRALIEQIAYQMQEEVFGGLSDEMQEHLDCILNA